ncbi:hypothetical protein [Actinomycetospora chiangmaiensis]|uniref:hypothetical protein n=1 Tax=Actinomycetospora chiangmaiensis TaxID=402650 RepID=UPI0003779F1D|nr:hypothetical protein [Actinomycetospora chiangmaiensis]
MGSETPHGAARAHERAQDAVDAARGARERSDRLRGDVELRRRRAERCRRSVDAATAAARRHRWGSRLAGTSARPPSR